MGNVQEIKEKVKIFFASPVYSTLVLVPLLVVVILVSSAVFLAVEGTEYKWTYYDAAYYVITSITTIGYGNYTPSTTGGKILTIFYIVLFVPLTMLTLAKTCQFITLGAKYLWMKLFGCLGKRNANCKVENVSLPLIIPVLVLLVYILIGSAIFLVLEKEQVWLSYFDMLYFVFVSLSTIGFGDIFPLNKDGFPFFVIYIFGGLILVAVCINVGFFDSVNTESERKDEDDKTTQNEDAQAMDTT